MRKRPLVAFFPEASFGSALNCVGIAQALQERGAEPVFICHLGFGGIFADYGFREVHLETGRDPDASEAEHYWQDFIERHLPHFNLSPKEQLETYVGPVWEAIVDTVLAVDDVLLEVLGRLQPDLVVLDHVIMYPAIVTSGRPWVRVVSCADTEISDDLVPPYLSGLPAADRTGWGDFSAAYGKAVRRASRRYARFRKSRGLPALPAGCFLEPSPWRNLLLSPALIRHPRRLPLPAERFLFLEGCVRAETPFDVPAFPTDEGPLIYMSFGSLGSVDTAMIDRMIRVFAGLPGRFIVNVGGFLEDYHDVPDNVLLGAWFPQPSVVAQADLFIHHGGNNSFCEALYFGVPSLVMPYAWDGHDNARRAEETGTGLAMARAGWRDEELAEKITRLLGDRAMKTRLRQNARLMQRRPGTRIAAEALLEIVDERGVKRSQG